MEKYIKMEEKFEGGRIERVFSADVMKLELFVMNTVELIKESERSVAFDIGIGGSILGDPVIHNDVIYFGACDRNLYAVSLDGKELWRFKTNDVVGSPNIDGENIYFGSFDGNFYCLDLKGNLIWKHAVNDKIISRPLIHKGRVYFVSRNGYVYALTTKGKLIWKFKTNGPIGADPLIYNDILYTGSGDKKFYAIDLEGNLLWKFMTNGITVGAYADESGIYFGSYDQNVYCLDFKGKKKWSFKTNQHLGRKAVCHNDIVYVICFDNNLYALKKDGSLLWKFSTGSSLFSAPCFDNENVYLASTDNNVYCIDQKTGKKKWRFACGGPIAVNLVMKGGVIFAGGWDCKMYAINTKGELVWTFPTSLSYVASVDVEPKQEELRTIQVVWDAESKSKDLEKYKERIETREFGGYGDFATSYIMSSDYTRRDRKKRYA